MKILTGTDIIEISRIKESIESLGDSFKNKIYTENEIEYCESKRNAKYQHYAGRFAAKEAIYKSVSAIFPHIALNEIEVLNDKNNLNRPIVNISNAEFKNTNLNIQIDVSISHIKEYAIAYATVNVNL